MSLSELWMWLREALARACGARGGCACGAACGTANRFPAIPFGRGAAAALCLLVMVCGVQRVEAAYGFMGNDRILLMNNDKRVKSAGRIENQGYYDTNTTLGVTYWEHTPNNDNVKTATRYLLHGTHHVMFSPEGEVLWNLEDCRAGYVAVGADGRNYIPYSENYALVSTPPLTTVKIGKTTYRYYENAENACVIMRNSELARVTSPYYEEGIGTIYFDVVNSFTAGTKSSVQLQITTNLTDDAVSQGLTMSTAGTNYEHYVWKTIPMTVLEMQNATNVVATKETDLSNLNVVDGGSSHYFRVRTHLNYYGPIRFRINRVGVDAGTEDVAGLILIDNVLASYPPMGVKLSRLGQDYDPELKGSEVLGCIGDFNSPFFSVGQTNVLSGLHIDWVTNYPNAPSRKMTISDVRLWFRRRYLNQEMSDYRSVSLLAAPKTATKEGDFVSFDLRSLTGVDLNCGVGDIEYYFSANLSLTQYYVPRDYANDSTKSPKGVNNPAGFGTMPGSANEWSEEIANYTNRATYTVEDNVPSCGTDYFVRIREGESDYEWVQFCASVTTNGTTGTKDDSMRMELVTNHTWRCHYYVPTNAIGETLAFHFQGKQLYKENADSFTYLARTNTWYSDLEEGVPYMPYTSVVKEEFAREATIVLDSVENAGTHLLVEFNDELHSFSVSHATYQDFNRWTDALTGFRGNANYNEENPTNGAAATGVSDTKTLSLADMRLWDFACYTNSLWREYFEGVETTDTTFPYDLHQSVTTTPNGWNAENGTFVRGQRGVYKDASGKAKKSLAWQMDGAGKGSISLVKKAVAGVEKVSFGARVSQLPSFEAFSTYLDGTACENYAISTHITMSRLYDSKRNPLDISPCEPSVSLVGYNRGSKGCYEFRITRTDESKVTLAFYKWTQVNGAMVATKIGATKDVTSNLLVPTSGAPTDLNSNWTTTMFSLYTQEVGGQTQVILDGWMANKKGASGISGDVGSLKENHITFTDTNPGPLTKGTYGVGSCDCQAAFGQIMYHEFASTYNTTASLNGVDISGIPQASYFADDWDLMYDRWRTFRAGESPTWTAGLSAVIPSNQTVRLYVAEATGSSQKNWVPVAGCEAAVASFSTNTITFKAYTTKDAYVQLRTGSAEANVTVSGLEAKAWAAVDRGEANYSYYDEWSYSATSVEAGKQVGTNATPHLAVLQPARGQYGDDGFVRPMGLRTPFLDNGMSLLSVDYENANSNCVLWLQICTNCTDFSLVSGYTTQSPVDPRGDWVTKCVWRFGTGANSTGTPVITNYVQATKENLKAGSLSYYQSLRAPTKGIMRVVVAPEVLAKAIASQGPTCDVDYGRITINKAYCYDEPALDLRSWWGWNLHTEGWNTADRSYAYLTDSPNGLSAMLNFSPDKSENSAADAKGIGLGEENLAEYKKENPFIQCPPLTNGIGTVSFRARKFNAAETKSSRVTLYGTQNPTYYQPEYPEVWEKLAEFEITNSTYRTFAWKTTQDSTKIQAVRLEVTGARHGRNQQLTPSKDVGDWEKVPNAQRPIQRVCIDEISVSEPIVPRLVFRNVFPFRSSQLRQTDYVAVSNVTSMNEQPITGESWGLQATVEPQQMGDELDESTMRVYAAFHTGISPWGFCQWSNDTRRVELVRMGDSLVYRSHISRPETIQPPIYSAETVQFMVWAEFKDKAGVDHVHRIESSEWAPPSWYYGIDNYNQLYGAGLADRFSCYTIVDSISPKRAWVNEVNYYNTEDNLDTEDKKNQFIEFAVPPDADLTGWKLVVTGNEQFSNTVLAVIGYEDAAGAKRKTGTTRGVDYTNNYTFVALCSPGTTDAETKKGCSGVWKGVSGNHIDSNGALGRDEPYGISLVRPSGVIEHQVIVEGRNYWETKGYDFLSALASGTNMLANIKAKQPNSQWFFAGRDQSEGTLGVFRSHGEDGSTWTNRMVSTPGALNRTKEGAKQDIDPDWFLLPNGTNVWIYAFVNGGHVEQVIAGETNRSSAVIVISKGLATNIVYNVDPWYAIGECTTNGVQVAGARGQGAAPSHRFVLNLGKVEENMTVSVGDQASHVVTNAGIAMSDPYYPAVMDWLSRTSTSDGKIYHAEHWTTQTRPADPEKLGIKDMYWLNINPSEPGWVLVAGMGGSTGEPKPGDPVCRPKLVIDPVFEEPATNVLVTVTMMITNTQTRAAHAPDRLQGLVPGSSSANYATDPNNWTSCTFKVTGALQKPGYSTGYHALRWFAFDKDSFGSDFKATIEIPDPFLPYNVGVNYGWPVYRGAYPIWYRFRLDGNGPGQGSTELLRPQSTLTE